GRKGALHGPLNLVTVLRLHQCEIGFVGRGELAGAYAADPVEFFGPGERVRDHVKSPAADMGQGLGLPEEKLTLAELRRAVSYELLADRGPSGDDQEKGPQRAREEQRGHQESPGRPAPVPERISQGRCEGERPPAASRALE